MEYIESMKDIKFESTDSISLSLNDINSVAKDRNLELTEKQCREVLDHTVILLNKEIEELSNKWEEVVQSAIRTKLNLGGFED